MKNSTRPDEAWLTGQPPWTQPVSPQDWTQQASGHQRRLRLGEEGLGRGHSVQKWARLASDATERYPPHAGPGQA